MKYASILLLLALTGCGESAGDYARNEKTRGAVRDLAQDVDEMNERLYALEKRVQTLEARP